MSSLYSVVAQHGDRWVKVCDGSCNYCDGWLDARVLQRPHLAMRLIRPDGTLMRDIQQRDDVSIGQVAGFPAPEQYEAAANKALQLAKAVRERQKEQMTRQSRQ